MPAPHTFRMNPTGPLRAACALLIAALALPAPAAWRSELYPENWTPPQGVVFGRDKFLQDFSYAGYRMGEQPIPDVRTGRQINVVELGADPTGTRDSTAAIQAALDRAAEQAVEGWTVVLLPRGTYRVSLPEGANAVLRLRSSRTVLRGAGVGATILLNTTTGMRSKSILLVAPEGNRSWGGVGSRVTEITGDLDGPSVDIPVRNAALFKPGDRVIVRAEINAAWVRDHPDPDWLVMGSRLGAITYHRTVVAVDARRNVLRIDVPTRHRIRRGYAPRVTSHEGMLEDVGLEDFSIGNVENPATEGYAFMDWSKPDTAGHASHDSYVIILRQVIHSWARRIDSHGHADNATGSHMLSNGILVTQGRHVTVQDMHFQLPQYGGGGGNGYMFRLDHSNEVLVSGCTSSHARHGFSIAFPSASGNVFHRHNDVETGRQTGGDGTTNGTACDHHMWFSHSNLIDQSRAHNSWYEAKDRFWTGTTSFHNITSAHGVFWNVHGEGERLTAQVVWSQQFGYGYVVGTSGPVNRVRLDGARPERAALFAPVDHVEGVGQGETLQPASLYLDQLARRLRR